MWKCLTYEQHVFKSSVSQESYIQTSPCYHTSEADSPRQRAGAVSPCRVDDILESITGTG